jgi:threonine aldolase
MIRTIDDDHGRFTADQLRGAVRPPARYAPESRLVAVEARSQGLKTHMDGARLFNACVKTGISASDYAAPFDTIWIDLTKGLGGFAGAVLAGSAGFVSAAWRLKQQWGGGLWQSGYIAATGLYALDNHIDRLADDHALASSIGERLKAMANVRSVLPLETNIVLFDIEDTGPTASDIHDQLLQQGVRVGVFGERTIRIVSHLEVDQAGSDHLSRCLEDLLGPTPSYDPRSAKSVRA